MPRVVFVYHFVYHKINSKYPYTKPKYSRSKVIEKTGSKYLYIATLENEKTEKDWFPS